MMISFYRKRYADLMYGSAIHLYHCSLNQCLEYLGYQSVLIQAVLVAFLSLYH